MVQASSLEHMLVPSVLKQYKDAVPESSCFFREAMTSVHLLAGFVLPAAWLPSYYPTLHLFPPWCPFLPLSSPLRLRSFISYESSKKAVCWGPQIWVPWFLFIFGRMFSPHLLLLPPSAFLLICPNQVQAQSMCQRYPNPTQPPCLNPGIPVALLSPQSWGCSDRLAVLSCNIIHYAFALTSSMERCYLSLLQRWYTTHCCHHKALADIAFRFD